MPPSEKLIEAAFTPQDINVIAVGLNLVVKTAGLENQRLTEDAIAVSKKIAAAASASQTSRDIAGEHLSRDVVDELPPL